MSTYSDSAVVTIRQAATTAGSGGTSLRELRSLHEVVEDAVAQAVTSRRDRGDTWAAIGQDLGVSRQRAQQKWGRR